MGPGDVICVTIYIDKRGLFCMELNREEIFYHINYGINCNACDVVYLMWIAVCWVNYDEISAKI